jgi:hypothetical protein
VVVRLGAEEEGGNANERGGDRGRDAGGGVAVHVTVGQALLAELAKCLYFVGAALFSVVAVRIVLPVVAPVGPRRHARGRRVAVNVFEALGERLRITLSGGQGGQGGGESKGKLHVLY